MNREVESIIFDLEYKIDINIDIDVMNLIRKVRELEIINNNLLTPEDIMKEYHIIALTYYRENKYKESISISKIVSEYARDINDEYYLAKSYGWIALNNLFLGNITKFEKYYNRSQNLFVKLEEYEDIALLTSRVLVVMCRNGYSKIALEEYLEKAMSYLERFHTKLSAQIYMSIASVYSIGLNNFEIAIDLYSKALEIAREYNILEIEAMILYYIGVGYYELNIPSKTIETFNNILSDERFKDSIVMNAIVALDLIGVHVDNRIDLNKVDKIIEVCENSINKLDYIKKEQYSVQLDLYKIKYYISTNKVNTIEAIELLNNAKKIYIKYGTSFIFTQVDFWIHQLFGVIYLHLGEYSEAIEAHNIALELSYNYQIRYTIESYEDLSRVYEKMGDYENAFLYMKKANTSRREVEHTGLIRKYMVTQDNYEKLRGHERERNHFFVTLSHELKTPVNIIYSSLQLLNLFKDKNDKAFKEYYMKHEKSVKQNCLRILKLINNIIDITKIDSGVVKPNFINYDIIQLVEDITMSVLSSVELKGIDIIFDTEVEEKLIKCDPNMIERIMLNLLSNAIKFSSDNGNILVSVAEERGYIIIEVKDDGIGVPLEMKNKIFNKFEQIDKSLNRKTEGSGIGLYIVKLLVELHSGYIELESEEGKGSEFRVYIPDSKKNEISEKIIGEKYNVLEERVITELSDIYIT